MGCHTEPAAVHIAHVSQRLPFFQVFKFFSNSHDYRKKKLLAFTAKKITRLEDFSVHVLHFSLSEATIAFHKLITKHAIG